MAETDFDAVAGALNSKTWTLIGSNTGSNKVMFNASDYEEIFIMSKAYADGVTPGYAIAIIPTAILTATEISVMLTGGYQGSSNGKCCYVHATNSYINNYFARNDGADYLSSSNITVYGR